MTDDACGRSPGFCARARTPSGQPLETITRVVVPAGASGLIAAILWGWAGAGRDDDRPDGDRQRGAGHPQPFDSVRTMTATIAAELGSVPQGGEQYRALFLVGAPAVHHDVPHQLVAELAVARMRKRLAL